MKLIDFCFIIVIIVSCNNTGESHTRKLIGDKYIESKFINDTMYDGLTKYYSLSNVLESAIEFNKGIKSGYSINYYPSGIVHDSMTFINGLAHGYHFVYDSMGNLEYKDYFYQGRKVGGLYFYKEGKIVEYDFVSFDGKLLYKAKYDEMGSIKEFGGEIITLNRSAKHSGDKEEDILFLYIPNPPSILIEYSIYVYDSVNQKKQNFKSIPQTQEMFIELVLPRLVNSSYLVQAYYLDSLNNFTKVYISPF